MKSEETKLTAFDAAILVVGIVFGSGIFVAPQMIAAFCKNGTFALLAWPLGACVAICGSLCYAESISRVRSEGGFFGIFQKTYGENFARTAGIVSQLVISPAALAGPVTIGGQALATTFLGTPKASLPMALSLLGLAAALNILGTQTSKIAQRCFVAIKVLVVLFLMCACVIRSFWGAQPPALPMADAGIVIPETTLAAFLGVILWTFDGWTEITVIGHRLKNPGRDLSRAFIYGLLSLATIFVVVQFSIMTILGVEQTASTAQPFSAAISVVFGPYSRVVVDAAIVLSTFTSAHGVMWMVSSLTQVMSKQGALPRQIAKINARANKPVASVLFITMLAALACLLDDFSRIVEVFSFFIWVYYGLMVGSLLILRRRKIGEASAWESPAKRFAPAVILSTSAMMTLSHFTEFPKACALGIIGFVCIYALTSWQHRHRGTFSTASLPKV